MARASTVGCCPLAGEGLATRPWAAAIHCFRGDQKRDAAVVAVHLELDDISRPRDGSDGHAIAHMGSAAGDASCAGASPAIRAEQVVVRPPHQERASSAPRPGRAKSLGNTAFSDGSSRSMAGIASSTSFPMVGVAYGPESRPALLGRIKTEAWRNRKPKRR